MYYVNTTFHDFLGNTLLEKRKYFVTELSYVCVE